MARYTLHVSPKNIVFKGIYRHPRFDSELHLIFEIARRQDFFSDIFRRHI